MPESNELLQNLIRLMARTYRQSLTAEEASVYTEWCKAIPVSQLEQVFREAMEASPSFMPTGPAISAAWKSKEPKKDMLNSEREWDAILAHVLKYGAVCYPSDKKLEVSASGEYSLRQVGGADWRQAIAAADDDRLHWLRANFIECWNRHAETGGLLAPSREEAKRMLDIAKRGHLIAEAGK